MTKELGKSLTQLGRQVKWPRSPDEARLEWVPNPHPGTLYVVRFTCPEFTSLCPLTGQPDFAHLVIDYLPKERLVESKSLKLFLGAFRNHGAFHEDCSLVIAKRLEEVLEPLWLRLGGYWYPPRRHADRCLLSVGRAAEGHLATRSGCGSLPWTRMRPQGGLAVDAPSGAGSEPPWARPWRGRKCRRRPL